MIYQPYSPQGGAQQLQRNAKLNQGQNTAPAGMPNAPQDFGQLLSYLNSLYKAQSFSQLNQSNSLEYLACVGSEVDPNTNLPIANSFNFNAFLGYDNQWHKADVSQQSWQIRMPDTNGFLDFNYSPAGADPIVWTTTSFVTSSTGTGVSGLAAELITARTLAAAMNSRTPWHTQDFVGDGATTQFTLSISSIFLSTEAPVFVFVGDTYIQEGAGAGKVAFNGINKITFGTAPAAAAAIQVRWQ